MVDENAYETLGAADRGRVDATILGTLPGLAGYLVSQRNSGTTADFAEYVDGARDRVASRVQQTQAAGETVEWDARIGEMDVGSLAATTRALDTASQQDQGLQRYLNGTRELEPSEFLDAATAFERNLSLNIQQNIPGNFFDNLRIDRCAARAEEAVQGLVEAGVTQAERDQITEDVRVAYVAQCLEPSSGRGGRD